MRRRDQREKPSLAAVPRSDGFTLVELLAVVALIALLAGVVGIALSDKGGSSLASAQKTIGTMVGAARAQAAVSQSETILAIYAARPPMGEADKYLSLMQVFRNDNPGGASPTYVPVGNPVSLPRGVHIVPPSTTGLLAAGVVWSTNPPALSTLRGPINLGPAGGAAFGTSGMAFVLDFAPDGTLGQVTASHARLVVATATRSVTNQPQFNNKDAVRGVLLRPTGAVTFVNDLFGF